MYGLESDLQDILIAHPDLFPGGENWEHLTGPHAAAGGWVDLLFKVGRRHYAVVEVKRGQADLSAIDQVVNYAQDLRARYGVVDAWVAAHVITDAVRRRAAKMGVKLLEIHPAAISHLLTSRIPRKAMRQGFPVPNDVALAELPEDVATVLEEAAARPHFTLDSWTNRTYLTYRGEDLLGVVRRGARHIFVKPSGSSRPETHDGLIAAGFTPMPKPGKYDHPWYRASWDDAPALRRAIRVLRSESRTRNGR